jgi:acetylxylan esterase
MTRYRQNIAAFLTVNAGLLLASAAAHAGSWQDNAPFGASLNGNLYTPTTPAESPAILVALHYCTGNSGNAKGWFDSYADEHGFYIIAPNAGKQCFESSATRGGDRQAIVDMVQYVIDNKGGNPDRVFAAGFSSGGCMTNVLLTVYPDVFKGGAAMPGFPGGGWPAGDTTCTKCGSSPPSTDGAYWGDIARNAFAWDGKYPCSQQWSGGADEYKFHEWMPAIVAQFQNLSGLDAGSPGTGAPNGWNRTEYKDADGNVRLQTNIRPGQAHDLTGSGLTGHVVSFLGLDKPTGACGIEDDAPVDTGSTSGEASTSVEVSVDESTGDTAGEDTTTTATTTSTTTTTSNTTTTTTSNSTGETTSATSSGGATTSAPTNTPTPPAPTTAPSATSTDTAAPSTTGTTADSSGDNAGCGCVVAGRPGQTSLALAALGGLGALLLGRRRNRRLG